MSHITTCIDPTGYTYSHDPYDPCRSRFATYRIPPSLHPSVSLKMKDCPYIMFPKPTDAVRASLSFQTPTTDRESIFIGQVHFAVHPMQLAWLIQVIFNTPCTVPVTPRYVSRIVHGVRMQRHSGCFHFDVPRRCARGLVNVLGRVFVHSDGCSFAPSPMSLLRMQEALSLLYSDALYSGPRDLMTARVMERESS